MREIERVPDREIGQTHAVFIPLLTGLFLCGRDSLSQTQSKPLLQKGDRHIMSRGHITSTQLVVSWRLYARPSQSQSRRLSSDSELPQSGYRLLKDVKIHEK